MNIWPLAVWCALDNTWRRRASEFRLHSQPVLKSAASSAGSRSALLTDLSAYRIHSSRLTNQPGQHCLGRKAGTYKGA